MADGGYQRPELWLSDGWATFPVKKGGNAPLYWERRQGDVVADDPSRHASRRPERTRVPRLVLRSGRLRAVAGRDGFRPKSEWEVAAVHGAPDLR